MKCENDEIRFIADNGLKPLAKMLRMLGVDCWYDGGTSLPDIIRIAALEDRILLSLKPIAETRRVVVLTLDSNNPADQLRQVSEAYSLNGHISLFSRCLVCNVRIEEVNDTVHKPDIPDSVRERGLTVLRCPVCKRPYWEGSHLDKTRKQLAEAGIVI
ncbi:MAG: Mut7-C RNAse domain-containing protein [Candidatus Hatepunaea meridiana]|nr:Mut7-C RNAse domain-containing protein [Candidatus Hatepunaea meridiana]